MKEPLETVTGAGHRLGDYIRDQRRNSEISLRQLADLAGVSNPYLSQIERGLRRPSAEILQQIAKGLRISAEALYLQAGILEHREGSPAVVDAVLADEGLSERQKQVLLEIYESFRKEGAAVRPAPAAEPEPAPADRPAARPRAGRTRTPRRAASTGTGDDTAQDTARSTRRSPRGDTAPGTPTDPRGASDAGPKPQEASA